jgi:hypothetical protein
MGSGKQEGVRDTGTHTAATEHTDSVRDAEFAAITEFEFRNRHHTRSRMRAEP